MGDTNGNLAGTLGGTADAFVRRYTDNGSTFTVNQTLQFGTSGSDGANGVYVSSAASPSQGVYVVGWTTGTLGQSNAGGEDAFVRKYSLDLQTVLWTKQFGTSTTDYGTAVSADGWRCTWQGTPTGRFRGRPARAAPMASWPRCK